MKKGSIIIGILTLSVIALSIWWSKSNKEDVVLHGKDKLVVQLQWFDGAQFCGLYVAQAKGFFDKENLVVELNPVSSFTSDPIAILLDGRADIAIATADQVLINKNDGKDIIAFGNVFNRSLACYISKSKNKIYSFNDFKGKKIAVYKKFDTENILLSLDKKNNIQIDSKDILQAGSIDAFLNEEYEILGSYLHNEPIDMLLQGINIEILDPVKDSILFYSDTYITNSTKGDINEWNKKREILIRFIRAANEGWKYTKNNQTESIKIMFDYVNNMIKDDMRVKKESLSLEKLVKYLGDGPNGYYSYMSIEKWNKMEESLFEIKRIKQTGYITDLCDFELVIDAYEKEKKL